MPSVGVARVRFVVAAHIYTCPLPHAHGCDSHKEWQGLHDCIRQGCWDLHILETECGAVTHSVFMKGGRADRWATAMLLGMHTAVAMFLNFW